MLVSVIIPTRNRADLLPDLLGSLREQNGIDFDWEIVLVDNGSSDNTEKVWSHYATSFPVPLRYVSESVPGLHRGRNRGAKEAQGKILAYLDDDMVVGTDWLHQGCGPIRRSEADVVIGKILPLWQGELPAWTHEVYDGKVSGYWGLLDLGDERKTIGSELAAGGNCFINKELVTALRGFHPDGMPDHLIRYRGDGETGFFRRAQDLGHIFMYEPKAVVHHKITEQKLAFEYILNRAFRQGISDSFSTIRKNGKMGTPIHTRIDNAYKRGMIFLREKILEDASLLEWILSNDYFDDKDDKLS
jgi:glycosyltransferase involved in cell wall biosynthesis